MRRQEVTFGGKIDWLLVVIYFILVFLGWLNIYAAVYDPENFRTIFDLDTNSGKQLLWIGTSMILILFIIVMDFRFWETFAYILFAIVMILLLAVLIFGREVNGAKAWFEIGSFRLQPAEFAKFTTALAVARYLQRSDIKITKIRHQMVVGGIIAIPLLLIFLQPDPGTALVFAAFLAVLYREGMSPALIILGFSAVIVFVLTLIVPQVYLVIGAILLAIVVIALGTKSLKRIAVVFGMLVFVVGLIMSVDYLMNDSTLLKPHHKNRFMVLVNPDIDPLGVGWNVTQSKIAIGSGGFIGKGFLDGTQTKFNFVPEQSTDFIFCTIGEEHGWVGSLILVVLFSTLFLRIIYIAERQKSRFARVYGYGVGSILFIHFALNIAMTIGLFPVIGIPLPFFSYGGSSLWSFTILLFILIKLDAHRLEVFGR
jgi:rod shape determining protein RodA